MARPHLACLAAAAVLAGPGGADPASAQAGPASTAMTVSLEVAPSCTVAAGPLAFGPVDGIDAPSHSATASIEVACGPGVPFAVAIDEGQNPGNGTRRVRDPATGEYAAYDIFADPAHSQRWGSFGAQAVAAVTTSGGTARLTAYGRVADPAHLAAGRYGDVVTITAEF
jgi:spore coat protein U-like protein